MHRSSCISCWADGALAWAGMTACWRRGGAASTETLHKSTELPQRRAMPMPKHSLQKPWWTCSQSVIKLATLPFTPMSSYVLPKVTRPTCALLFAARSSLLHVDRLVHMNMFVTAALNQQEDTLTMSSKRSFALWWVCLQARRSKREKGKSSILPIQEKRHQRPRKQSATLREAANQATRIPTGIASALGRNRGWLIHYIKVTWIEAALHFWRLLAAGREGLNQGDMAARRYVNICFFLLYI